MKRLLMAIPALALVAGSMGVAAQSKMGGAVDVPMAQEQSIQRALNRVYSKSELAGRTYVGSETCLSCHVQYTGWRDTKHQQFIRRPMGMYTLQSGKGVMANQAGGTKDDFMVGLDLNTSAAFSAQEPNAPILSYNASNDTYYMKVGSVKMKLVATLAGYTGGAQRYMVRIPLANSATGWSNSIYFAPAAYDDTAKIWTPNSPSTWWNGNVPILSSPVTSEAIITASVQGQNYMKTCSGCHITGIKSVGKWPNGEYMVKAFPAVIFPAKSPYYPDLNGNGRPALADIGCEMCHGPGSAHVLGGGDVSKIVNPANITNNQQRSEVCLQCHVQVASSPNKTWGFPYDEVNNKPFIISNPPDPLSQYQVFTGAKWPDGVHYESARVDSYYSSAHYQGAHGIACNDCHDAMEETANPAQVSTSFTEFDATLGKTVTVNNASVDDDSLCLSCHANYGSWASLTKMDIKNWKASGMAAPIPVIVRKAIEAHTHHPYGAANPDGTIRMLGQSSCVTCHMAPEAGHGDISGASHTFWPSRPEDTIKFKDVTGLAYGGSGNVNCCAASCHRNQVRIWTDIQADNSSPNNQFGEGYMSGAPIGLANYLVQYYGPGGAWWDTSVPVPNTMDKAYVERRQ